MKYDVIEIDTSRVPYEFNIVLADETFLIGVEYNETGEFFTLSLSKLDETTGEYVEVCAGEPVVYGVPLWKDVYRSDKFPSLVIVPYDESGEANSVTFDNLGRNVFLIVDDSEE